MIMSAKLGGWWCPDCGKWIATGEGRITNDNFMVHRWCR